MPHDINTTTAAKVVGAVFVQQTMSLGQNRRKWSRDDVQTCEPDRSCWRPSHTPAVLVSKNVSGNWRPMTTISSCSSRHVRLKPTRERSRMCGLAAPCIFPFTASLPRFPPHTEKLRQNRGSRSWICQAWPAVLCQQDRNLDFVCANE